MAESDDDVAPTPLKFLPARKPGVKLSSGDDRTPLDFFKLFFSDDAVETLCRNTNKRAARSTACWTDVGAAEFYSYIGLIFYMSMVKLKNTAAFWRENSIFTIPFPSQVMSKDRYQALSWNEHMSDPDEDRINDTKTGTSEHDRLFRVKPLMETIQKACKSFYHPSRSLVVDERVVPCTGHSRRKRTVRNTPSKCFFKLFVLTDSSNGYTVDFSVYTGRNNFPTGRGLSYDSVMSLIDRKQLGSGYHVYMDSFYTSPKLFKDLLASEFGACGTYRDSRRDCPRSAVNTLTKTSHRGTLRWIRDGPLLFVEWMNSHVSDQLIQFYATQHKIMKWYRKLFLHFLDISATNAYILHKELMKQDSVTQKAFMEELVAQLCGVTQKTPAKKASGVHVPVSWRKVANGVRMKANAVSKSCVYCKLHRKKRSKTPWKCKTCEVYLCVQPDRNCFEAWHPD